MYHLHRQFRARWTTLSPTPSRTTRLVAVSVLSGNRNFEGRVHANVRANYLASPPLVVAYALLGNIREDIATQPLGTGTNGKPVFLKDVWPTNKEIEDLVTSSVTREQFLERYGVVTQGTPEWQALRVETGSETYRWTDGSTYVKNPPYFDGITMEPAPRGDITARPYPRPAGRQHHHRPHQPQPATSRNPAPPANIWANTRSRKKTSTATAAAVATTK